MFIYEEFIKRHSAYSSEKCVQIPCKLIVWLYVFLSSSEMSQLDTFLKFANSFFKVSGDTLQEPHFVHSSPIFLQAEYVLFC